MSRYTLGQKFQLATSYYYDKIKRNLSLSDPKAWNPSLWNLYGLAKTESGVAVTEETATNLSSVYAAINIISSDIASLPIHLYRKQSNGKRKIITDHPALERLNYLSNPFMPAVRFRQTTMAHILAWGNMYPEIVRDGLGRIAELWPITPDRVFPEWKSGVLRYRIKTTGADIYLPQEKVLHVAGLGFDGFTGYSVIRKAAESIGLSIASEKFGARYFGANTNMGGAIKYPRALGEDAKKNLKASLADYTGGKHSHRWMILEQGMEIEKLGFSPDDSQFLQTRQFQVSEIARWFNMPPHKLKDLIRSTFSNIEEQEIEYYTGTITPWTNTLEQSYNIQLLTPKEHKLGYYFKHSLKGVLRGNSNARADYYTKRFYLGTITPNEIRAFEDEEPLDTEYADKTYIQMNLMPLDDIDKEPVLPPAPKNLPGEQPVEEIKPEEKSIDWARDKLKLLEYRNIIARDRVAKRYHPLVEDAAEQVIFREFSLIKNQFKGKALDIEKIYATFKKFVIKKMSPVFTAFSDSIFNQALLEVGESVDETPTGITSEVNRYTDVYATRHVASSSGQLLKIVTDNDEDIQELVMQRVDEWKDTRPKKIANNESVRLSSFVAQTAFFSYGFKSYWRIRGPETCPYCQELNGRAIKQGQSYFEGGEEHEPKGATSGPMLIRGMVTHPPLHQGCDCYISVR